MLCLEINVNSIDFLFGRTLEAQIPRELQNKHINSIRRSFLPYFDYACFRFCLLKKNMEGDDDVGDNLTEFKVGMRFKCA